MAHRTSLVGLCLRAIMVFTLIACTPLSAQSASPPTLADLWTGRAEFVTEQKRTGLPMGESDTVIAPNGEWWSFVHASARSAGIKDSCGAPVTFPGCVVIYTSHDAGQSFGLDAPVCQIKCNTCPCDAERDHPQQQQYPRVVVQNGVWLMAYEFGAKSFVRGSRDGQNWGDEQWVFNTGVWTHEIRTCQPWEQVRPHPFAKANYECLAGGPPGIRVDGNTIYVFVGLGQDPGAMGCFVLPFARGDGLRIGAAARAQPCAHNPLFIGNWQYGDLHDVGVASNTHFDFRTISAAKVIKTSDRYYMLYEGVRGPGPIDVGDNQFGLGLARSVTGRIDGPWEKMSQPILANLPGNIGIGHADIVVVPNGETILFTSLDGISRSRLRLVWKTPGPQAAPSK